MLYLRYGFNGQEQDDEVHAAAGTAYTAEYWEYDPRLGRRWNLDPRPDPSLSEYSCFANNPLFNTDIKGDTIRPKTEEGSKIINEGLNSALGKKNPFSYNKAKGVLDYNKIEGAKYTDKQQELIDKYSAMVSDERDVFVNVVNRDEFIPALYYVTKDLNKSSLAGQNMNGVTLSDGGFANIFIARDPVGSEADRGRTSLHEIGGHAFYHLFLPQLSQADNFLLTEQFMTRMRSIFRVREIVNFGNFKRGYKHNKKSQDYYGPWFLGGQEPKH